MTADAIPGARSASMADVPRPALPDGIRIYAVGDIHGCADLLAKVFTRIDADRAASPPVRCLELYLGDLIDRGPASREVIDLLIERGGRREIVCLKGNHEDLALRFLAEPRLFATWAKLGGRETLMSYGLTPLVRGFDEQSALARAFGAALPPPHRSFLMRLPVFHVCGDFLFVHAGIKPGIALDRQRETDLLWIRDEFLNWGAPFEKVVVHGHTPVLEPQFLQNRINIDTGAYATGKLTCLRIEGFDLRVI
jgi:serine/threonine protein phosphatase 1